MKITWRVWILIAVLILSLLSIFGLPPKFMEDGVLIKSVEKNSTAFDEGLRQGQIIQGVNSIRVDNLDDYTKIIEDIFEKNPGEERKVIIQTKTSENILFISEPPKITLSDIPFSQIKTGLDLHGGSRALVKAEGKSLSSKEIQDLISITNNRLNVYGLTDINIRAVSDLSGENYMLIEIAGATPTELKELISEQGKFEAKIGEEIVFIGGNKDITHVCRDDATCARVESCYQVQDGYSCRFSFQISLKEEAAKRHAQITDKLGINVTEAGNRYLDKKLDLYLDDNLVESLFISEELKGKETTQISVQGSGSAQTQQEAAEQAQEQMNKLQTILITGSLPYKLEIVKLDTTSPLLGEKFTRTIFIAGLIAVVAVSIIIFIRYRKIKPSLLLLFTSMSEILIILGLASLINWNLDLPSIAGIIAVIGTGVDQQIVILDESSINKLESIKQRIKRALFIIFAAFFTTLASLIPLYWAGAGLLKGFAVTTIMGITAAVLITRPAFADIIKNLEND